MNNVFVAVVVGLIAGAGGGLLVHLLGDATGASSSARATVDLTPIEDRLARIEADVQAIRNPPETLAGRGPADDSGVRPGGDPLPGGSDAVESLLAKIDERVGRTVERKLEEMKAGGEEKGSRSGGRRSKRRVPLAEAARELELSGQQEDELRRIYQDSQDKVFNLLAKPDGDPEEVKREILEAVGTPGGTAKVIGKYMPKVLGNLGEFMMLQTERESAINKALGPDKARQLKRDYSIEEDDILGLQGEMRMDWESRGGR